MTLVSEISRLFAGMFGRVILYQVVPTISVISRIGLTLHVLPIGEWTRVHTQRPCPHIASQLTGHQTNRQKDKNLRTPSNDSKEREISLLIMFSPFPTVRNLCMHVFDSIIYKEEPLSIIISLSSPIVDPMCCPLCLTPRMF